LKKRETETVKT